MRIIFFIFISLLFQTCGPIDPPLPVDEDGKIIPQPRPFDRFLSVEKVEPAKGKIGIEPVLWIYFSDYLDNDAWLDQRAISLNAGGRRTWGLITNMFSQKAVIFTANSPLIDGLSYTLDFREGAFFSTNAAPFKPPEGVVFVADSTIESQSQSLPNPTWSDIKPILEKKCEVCHADPNWGLSPLSYEMLIGKKSKQVDKFLVRAFDSSDSYLLHKIIPDFTERKFTVQPPPWSGAEALTADEILKIDRWIELGAQKN